MKYFTPELILRGQSEDPDVVDEVEATWENHGQEYALYLEQVQDRYPPGIRHIEDSYYLHDADVLGIGINEMQIIFYLRLDPPPQSLLTFRYDLVEPPVIDREAFPEHFRDRSAVKQWQYDELELVEGEPPTWRQAILLSNGWEITLHFRDVAVEEIAALLPVPRKSTFSTPPDLLPAG